MRAEIESHYFFIVRFGERYIKEKMRVNKLDLIDLEEILIFAEKQNESAIKGLYHLHHPREGEPQLFYGEAVEIYNENTKQKSDSEKVMSLIDAVLAPQKKIKLTAPAIALFCYYANESKALSREPDENIGTYCKRVCRKFKITYTDRVRQNYSVTLKGTTKNIKKVKELILPLVDNESKLLIQAYLAKNK